MKKIFVDVEGISDIGTVKSVNEDRYVYKVADIGESTTAMFAVADGVGGLAYGDIASSIAISNINKWWENEYIKLYSDINQIKESLKELFNIINLEIREMSESKKAKMATTLSLMLIHKDEIIICHIGDSRIYRIRKNLLNTTIKQLTVDHSSDIKFEMDNVTYYRSVLTQCLGAKEDIECYIATEELHKRDKYILCSDGIYKTMTDNDIKKIIDDNVTPLDICCNLVNEVKNRGEKDNITIIGILVSER